MSRFLVFRLPCTQEDEGRKTFIGERETCTQAEWLLQESLHGYYYRSDFEIVEVN